MESINKGSIGSCIFLSIITCGLYLLYWEYLIVKNVRTINKDDSDCTGEMLCLIFVPFYFLFWSFTRGKSIRENFSKYGYSASSDETTLLVFSIFGLGIISLAIMQNDFNSLPDGLNRVEPIPSNQVVNNYAPITVTSENVSGVTDRIFMLIEESDWGKANFYCEQVLLFNPKSPKIYLAKVLIDCGLNSVDSLSNYMGDLRVNKNYNYLIKFAGEDTEELKKQIENISARNEENRLFNLYNIAANAMSTARSEQEYIAVSKKFDEISSYKNSETLSKECLEKAEICSKDSIYNNAKGAMSYGTIAYYAEAIEILKNIPGWRDSDNLIIECQQRIEELKVEAEERRAATQKAAKKIKKILAVGTPILCVCIAFIIVLNTVIIPKQKYNKAMNLISSGDYNSAYALLEKIGDNDTISLNKYNRAIEAIKSKNFFTAKTLLIGLDYEDSASILRNLSASTVSAGIYHTVSLKSDGTVVATNYTGSYYDGQCGVSDWIDIVAVSAGDYHTIGLKADGTVVATKYIGDYNYGQCDVSDWTDIVAVSAGHYHTIGLKSDGTVVATGDNDDGQCDVYHWRDIVAVSAGYCHTVGLKSDGTVVATGYNYDGQCDVSDWTDIVAVSAGDLHTVGLKSDGTVVATKYTGDYYDGQCYVSNWKDIVAVSAGHYHTIGLKSDGTVVATNYTGNYYDGQCDVSDWKDIKIPQTINN